MLQTASVRAQPATETNGSKIPAREHIRAESITKRFDRHLALDDVSLGIGLGSFVTILGPSGCGKTTLLRTLAGLESADRGRVLISGRDVSRDPPGNRRCGIVFQSYALFPNLTAEKNIAFGLDRRRFDGVKRAARAREMLELVGLGGLERRFPSQLSGGQQQRVALARALAPSPEILLLDEPFSALDARVRVSLRQEMRRIQRELNVTTVMVTHDQEEALTLSDQVVVMDHARVIQADTPEALYARPASRFVAGFLGSMNFLELDEGVIGVRPEHLRIDASVDSDVFQLSGVVQWVEFRGVMTRVSVLLDQSNAVLIDLLSEQLDRGSIASGKRVAVWAHRHHLHHFGFCESGCG